MTVPPETPARSHPGDAVSAALPGRRIRRTRDLAYINYRSDGLVPVVTQDSETDEILMLAYANRTSLALTLDTGQMYYWSRSRRELWRKGATSGNVLSLKSLHLDCDADAVLARVRPAGPACHTGARTCFVDPGAEEPEPAPAAPEEPEAGEPEPAAPGEDDAEERPTFRGGEVLDNLWTTLRSRAEERPPDSNTARLLADKNLRLKKLGEELVELTVALTRRDADAVTREAADLLYHVLVALVGANVSLHTVGAELARRATDHPTAPED